jgi:hypothetical protein
MEPELLAVEDELARAEPPSSVTHILIVRRGVEGCREFVATVYGISIEDGERSLVSMVCGRSLVVGHRVRLVSAVLELGFADAVAVFP